MIPSLALTVPRYPSPVLFFSLGVPFTEGQAKLPLPLYLSLSLPKAQGLPIHGLGLPFAHYKWALAHGLGFPHF